MRLVRYAAPRKIEIITAEKPQVSGPDDVLVRIAYAGICDDDIPLYTMDTVNWPLPSAIAGHEFSGTVEALGENARKNGFCEGDRVSGQAWLFCGTCHYCCLLYTSFGYDNRVYFMSSTKILLFSFGT